MANEQKNPLALRLPEFVRHEIRNWVARNGKAMPGHVVAISGAIVTVSFDVTDLVLPLVQMPVIGAEYIRLPIQAQNLGTGYAGDKGGCLPFDYYMGGVSGLGSSPTADSSPQGNLANLIWLPIGSKSWSSVDPNAVTIYGPNGVVLRDSQSKTTSTLTPTGISDSAQDTYSVTAGTSITLSVGSHSIVINDSGVTIDGVAFLTHTHSAVQPGTGVSGPVVP